MDDLEQARRRRPELHLECPRCHSTNIRFCYLVCVYSPPRHLCRDCNSNWAAEFPHIVLRISTPTTTIAPVLISVPKGGSNREVEGCFIDPTDRSSTGLNPALEATGTFLGRSILGTEGEAAVIYNEAVINVSSYRSLAPLIGSSFFPSSTPSGLNFELNHHASSDAFIGINHTQGTNRMSHQAPSPGHPPPGSSSSGYYNDLRQQNGPQQRDHMIDIPREDPADEHSQKLDNTTSLIIPQVIAAGVNHSLARDSYWVQCVSVAAVLVWLITIMVRIWKPCLSSAMIKVGAAATALAVVLSLASLLI